MIRWPLSVYCVVLRFTVVFCFSLFGLFVFAIVFISISISNTELLSINTSVLKNVCFLITVEIYLLGKIKMYKYFLKNTHNTSIFSVYLIKIRNICHLLIYHSHHLSSIFYSTEMNISQSMISVGLLSESSGIHF